MSPVGVGVGVVGVIVNPVAGKDIRRLVTAASHTSDSTKIGIVRRAVIAAVEAGATRVLLSGDPHHLADRAIDGLDLPAEVLDERLSGTRADTVAFAARMWKEHASAVIALGGDGTCRDVVLGWPDAPLVAVSTGTNNVYPRLIDATSAGTAAGLVACGAIDVGRVTQRSKRITLRVHSTGSREVDDDIALVDAAMIDGDFVGSRAVLDPGAVRSVVAAFATPASTGLSAIAGRVHPVDRGAPGGVHIVLGPGGRRVRVPISPGSFATVEIRSVTPLAPGEQIELTGPGILAVDGERDRRVGAGTVVTASVDPTGPWLIDVESVLRIAAAEHLFEEQALVQHALAEQASENHGSEELAIDEQLEEERHDGD